MNMSPELAELLERRRVLDAEMVRATGAADALEFTLRRGSTALQRADLDRLRQAQIEAEEAADSALRAIAAFPSRSVADVAAKMRIVACEIEGVALGPDAKAEPGEMLNTTFARGVALDLNRLAASSAAPYSL
jgi:hypothetical protein